MGNKLYFNLAWIDVDTLCKKDIYQSLEVRFYSIEELKTLKTNEKTRMIPVSRGFIFVAYQNYNYYVFNVIFN